MEEDASKPGRTYPTVVYLTAEGDGHTRDKGWRHSVWKALRRLCILAVAVPQSQPQCA